MKPAPDMEALDSLMGPQAAPEGDAEAVPEAGDEESGSKDPVAVLDEVAATLAKLRSMLSPE